MIQAAGTLLAIAFLSFVSKDRLLMAASLVLAVLVAVDNRPAFALLQKSSFQIGIFFLLLFLLLPIASQKIPLTDVARQLAKPECLLAIVAGFGVSVIGGKGIAVLVGHPAILLGVIIGTLIAVLLFKGLPAGLIIAAGLISFLL